jgi:uncharacterized cofD-like protein
MSLVPLEMVAHVLPAAAPTGEPVEVRGQVAVATTSGRVLDVAIEPPDPPACPEAIAAIETADWVLLGPGSWFTSVLPHLLVPELAAALVRTNARRIVNLNLVAQPGETAGYSPATHLEVLSTYAPDLRIDVVIADTSVRLDAVGYTDLVAAAKGLGAELVCADVAAADGPFHDAERLAGVYQHVFESGRIDTWR